MRQALKVPGITDVVVATDVEAIAVVVQEHGGDAMLTNPDHQSGTDRVAEVAMARGYDRVINLQGDEPFIDPRDLSAIAKALDKPGCDIATLKRKLESRDEMLNPSVVKVVTRDDGQALYFSRAAIPYDRSGSGDITRAFRHIGVYGYTRDALERMTREDVHPLEQCEGLEQLRALALGMCITVIPAVSIGHGIDTEADLAWAREHVARHGEAAFPSAITDKPANEGATS